MKREVGHSIMSARSSTAVIVGSLLGLARNRPLKIAKPGESTLEQEHRGTITAATVISGPEKRRRREKPKIE